MRRWTIKPPVLVGLLAMLFLVGLILVLPDVDLPDAAFHQSSAPVLLHARTIASPGSLAVAAFIVLSLSFQSKVFRSVSPRLFGHTSVDSLPILYRSLRC